MIAISRIPTYSANLAGLSAMMLMTPAAVGLANLVIDECKEAQLQAPSSSDKSVGNAELPQRFLQRIAVRPLLQQIERYSEFTAGWDGLGSVAPSQAARSAARKFLLSLAAGTVLPDVTAAGDGEISISWRSPERYVDVSFFGETGAAFVRMGGEKAKARNVRWFSDLPQLAIDSFLEA